MQDAQPAIVEALDRLLQAPLEHRCFVIVNDLIMDRFVQFGVRLNRRVLFLDLPYVALENIDPERSAAVRRLFTLADRDEHAFVREVSSATIGAELAMRVLREVHLLPEFAQLKIVEESSTAPEKRN